MNQFDYANVIRSAKWIDVAQRSSLLPELSANLLLHAGPPYRSGVPAPVANAAATALIYEGVAKDMEEGISLVNSSRFTLKPAQEFGVVTPLAQVVSDSMPLAVVQLGTTKAYAPLVEGGMPALRFGSAGETVLKNLRDLIPVAEHLAKVLRFESIPVDEIVSYACRKGDECHSLTGNANQELLRLLGDVAHAGWIDSRPAFVLPIIMAACYCAIQEAQDEITGIGGNGAHFGIRGRDGEWICVPAPIPHGTLFRKSDDGGAVLPAIGDSPVIDFCGLGGQALSLGSALVDEWTDKLPPDAIARRDLIVNPVTGLVDQAAVASQRLGPLVNLAMLDERGTTGLIGRGFIEVPYELFHHMRSQRKRNNPS